MLAGEVFVVDRVRQRRTAFARPRQRRCRVRAQFLFPQRFSDRAHARLPTPYKRARTLSLISVMVSPGSPVPPSSARPSSATSAATAAIVPSANPASAATVQQSAAGAQTSRTLSTMDGRPSSAVSSATGGSHADGGCASR